MNKVEVVAAKCSKASSEMERLRNNMYMLSVSPTRATWILSKRNVGKISRLLQEIGEIMEWKGAKMSPVSFRRRIKKN